LPLATAFDPAHATLSPAPIEPSWIRAGAPVARAVTITNSPDGLLSVGVWDCTAGTFTWIFGSDEIVHVLEGEARVRHGDTTHVLVPGAVAYFPRGLETVWEVPRYVKKAFILRAPHRGRLRRAASAVKRRLSALAGRAST
jgi:uncharacterized cupin superfamily protein